MMTPQDKLRHIVKNAENDNLKRARAAFRGLDLDVMHGQSGMTRREWLTIYERERGEWQSAKDLLDRLLRLLT